MILKLENTTHILVDQQCKIFYPYSLSCFLEKLQKHSCFSCCECVGLNFCSMKSYRQKTTICYDNIAFLLSI